MLPIGRNPTWSLFATGVLNYFSASEFPSQVDKPNTGSLEHCGKQRRCFTLRLSKKMSANAADNKVGKPEGRNRMQNTLITKRLAEGKKRVICHEPERAEHKSPRTICAGSAGGKGQRHP